MLATLKRETIENYCLTSMDYVAIRTIEIVIMAILLCAILVGLLNVKNGCLLTQIQESAPMILNSDPGMQVSQSLEDPLLLNSHCVTSKTAELKIIAWFDGSSQIPPDLPAPPLKDWSWSRKSLQAGQGRLATTFSGSGILNLEEEKNVYTWYTMLVSQIAAEGGRLYIDERIPEGLDDLAYLSRIQAVPVQWSLDGNLISIAAYQKNCAAGVQAGRDQVNVQILSRGEPGNSQTVLAMPALLEEF